MAQQPMGLGEIGDRSTIFKRKFRWTFRVDDICSGDSVPEHFVKMAARPNVSIEETEINFLNGKTWIPGKATWETITVQYYDVASIDNRGLWRWLASVYDFTDPINLKMGSSSNQYAGEAVIKMFDGCGTPLENWILQDCWPTTINWGELDYTNSEECNIELTLRYSQVTYTPLCPKFEIRPCCDPCVSGQQG